MNRVLYVISALTAFLVSFNAAAQIKPIPFGNMEHWMVRQVDESAIIGGKTKFLYEVASGDTLKTTHLMCLI